MNRFIRYLNVWFHIYTYIILVVPVAVVLCPLSVTDGWVSEIEKFTPGLKALRYVGDKEHRCSLRKAMYTHVKEHSISDVSFGS